MKQNEGADQLPGYCTADMRFCFRTCKSRFYLDAEEMITFWQLLHHIR